MMIMITMIINPSRTWEELAREFLGGRDPPSGVRVVLVVARLVRARQLDFEFPFILRALRDFKDALFTFLRIILTLFLYMYG